MLLPDSDSKEEKAVHRQKRMMVHLHLFAMEFDETWSIWFAASLPHDTENRMKIAFPTLNRAMVYALQIVGFFSSELNAPIHQTSSVFFQTTPLDEIKPRTEILADSEDAPYSLVCTSTAAVRATL